MPFPQGEDPEFQRQSVQADFPRFGCHKGGDVFVLREFENPTFVETVQRLAERARIPIEFEMTLASARKPRVKENCDRCTSRWPSAGKSPWPTMALQDARDYLAKRGVSDEAVRRFRMGYAPDKWDDTLNWPSPKTRFPVARERRPRYLRRQGPRPVSWPVDFSNLRRAGQGDRLRGRLRGGAEGRQIHQFTRNAGLQQEPRDLRIGQGQAAYP